MIEWIDIPGSVKICFKGMVGMKTWLQWVKERIKRIEERTKQVILLKRFAVKGVREMG